MGIYNQYDRIRCPYCLHALRSRSVIAICCSDIVLKPRPVFLAIKGVEAVEASGGVSVDSVFGDKIFRNIILSLAATYGLYIVASLLALEPWHMRTLPWTYESWVSS